MPLSNSLYHRLKAPVDDDSQGPLFQDQSAAAAAKPASPPPKRILTEEKRDTQSRTAKPQDVPSSEQTRRARLPKPPASKQPKAVEAVSSGSDPQEEKRLNEERRRLEEERKAIEAEKKKIEEERRALDAEKAKVEEVKRRIWEEKNKVAAQFRQEREQMTREREELDLLRGKVNDASPSGAAPAVSPAAAAHLEQEQRSLQAKIDEFERLKRAEREELDRGRERLTEQKKFMDEGVRKLYADLEAKVKELETAIESVQQQQF